MSYPLSLPQRTFTISLQYHNIMQICGCQNLTDFEDEMLRALPTFQGTVHNLFWKKDSFPCECGEVLALRAVNSSALQWARILSGCEIEGIRYMEIRSKFQKTGLSGGRDSHDKT